jgi:hypothetical protein
MADPSLPPEPAFFNQYQRGFQAAPNEASRSLKPSPRATEGTGEGG